MNWFEIDKLILDAFNEDFSYGDITTESIIKQDSVCKVNVIAKEDGLIAGIEIFKRVFEKLGNVKVSMMVVDGDRVLKNQKIGCIHGNTINILKGERTALNFLQKLSGIATLTNKFVKELEGFKTKLLDTRKTTPTMRLIEKYAVKVGGGCNHRFNLSDGVLIKDNHISAAGGINKAVSLVKRNVSFVRKIEVEVENLFQVNEAIKAGADIIMLDNMSYEDMKKAVDIIDGRAIIEASGNITIDNIKLVAGTGVDFISTSAIVNSAKTIDISMKDLEIVV